MKPLSYFTLELVMVCIVSFGPLQAARTNAQTGRVTLYTPCVNGLKVNVNGIFIGSGLASNLWDWGDGQQRNAYFPNSHTYSTPGQYTLTVTAYYSNGTSNSSSAAFYTAPGVLSNCVSCRISAGQGGSVSYQASVGSGTVAAGTSVTLQQAYADNALLTANASGKYVFLDWSPSPGMTGPNATPVLTNLPSTWIVVNSNSQIAADFALLALGVNSPPWGAQGFNLLVYAPTGSNVLVQVATNVTKWSNWTSVTIPYAPYPLSDPFATTAGCRFYQLKL